MDDLILFGSGELTASNSDSRILEGKIVAFNVKGSTSAGMTIFSSGSIKVSDVTKIKLNDEHNNSMPVGRMMSMRETSDGIFATFKISKSAKGNDALILASEGLKTGFSVGVINAKYEREGDCIRVTSADLQHVAHCEKGAIAGAEITRVAASETAPTQPTEQESEAPVTTAPAEPTEVAPPEVAPETVEASQVQASEKVTRPATPSGIQVIGVRSPINSAGSYLQHMMKVKVNPDSVEARESRQYLGQAEAIFAKAFSADGGLSIDAANNSFTTNPAFKPIQYMNQFISNTRNFGRPTIEACGGTQALPSQGMTFSIPKLSTAPTVSVTTEAQAVQGNTGMVTAYITGTKKKYAGTQIISREIIDNGSDSPLFYTELMAELNAAYDYATNAAAIAEIVANGTQAATAAGTLAGLESTIGVETPGVYTNTSFFARNLVAAPIWWGDLIGALDTTGRPIFNSAYPMNAGGNAQPTAARGNVLGLDLFVDRQMVNTRIDDSAFIIAPEAIGLYESPRIMLSIEVLPTLEYQVALYGYFTALTKQATGLIRYNLT